MENSNQNPVTLPSTGFIRLSDLVKFIPFGKATVYRKVKAGKFPKPKKLSERITAWAVEDIREWIAAQSQA